MFVDHLCNVILLSYKSINLVNCIRCRGENSLGGFPWLSHRLGSRVGIRALPALETQSEPLTAQPWLSGCSQLLLFLHLSLLGGGTWRFSSSNVLI